MEELVVQYLSEGPRYCHYVSLSSLTQHPNSRGWVWGQPTPSILVTDVWCRIVTVLEEDHGPFRRQAAQSSRVDIREAVRKLWHFRKRTLELNEL